MLVSCIVWRAAISSFACIVVEGKPIRLTPPWSTKLTKTRDFLVDLRTLPPAVASSPVKTAVKISGVTCLPE